MKNIIILGASGFVGYNLVKIFYKKYNLKLFDIKKFNNKKFPNVVFEKKNLLDLVEADFPNENFIVINTAACLGSKNYYDKYRNCSDFL